MAKVQEVIDIVKVKPGLGEWASPGQVSGGLQAQSSEAPRAWWAEAGSLGAYISLPHTTGP